MSKAQLNKVIPTGAVALIQLLEKHGVTHIFGIPGAKIDSLFIALLNSTIKLVICRHEQNAAFMAAAMGRMTGKVGVCIATSGPGVTNLVTGLATATAEGDPVLAIGGEVSIDDRLKRTHQSIDAINLMRPVTKYSEEVSSINQLGEILGNAIRTAEEGRQGAVFIGFPKDIGFAEMPVSINESFGRRVKLGAGSMDEINLAASTINQSKKPILILGDQASRPEYAEVLKAFLSKTGIPYISTFQGPGAWAEPANNPTFAGRVGLFRNQPSDQLLDSADCVMTVGFNPIEYDPSIWNTNNSRPIITIDFLKCDQDRSFIPIAEVIGDIGASLSVLSPLIEVEIETSYRVKVEEEIDLLKVIVAKGATMSGTPVHPLRVISELEKVITTDTTIALDVGSHYIWMNRYFRSQFARQVLVSNGQQTLGVALPWAIAANLARPGYPVISISGDGGFLFSAMELETAKRIGSRFVHLIWDSGSYDMVSFQEAAHYDGKTNGVKLGYYDIKTYAEAFGCNGYKINHPDELLPALIEGLKSDAPVLIHIPIDYSDNMKLMSNIVHDFIH